MNIDYSLSTNRNFRAQARIIFQWTAINVSFFCLHNVKVYV